MNPHRTLFSQHPLFQLAVAFALGISAASYLPAKFGFSLATCAVCSVVSMVLTLRERVRSAGLALLMALFFAGETLALLEARTMPQTSFIEGESLTLTGVLDGPVEFVHQRTERHGAVHAAPGDDDLRARVQRLLDGQCA